MNEQAKYTPRPGTVITDTGTVGVVDTNGDISEVDCRDLQNVVANVNCDHAGTGHAILEGSWDGANWKTLINEFDCVSFVAGTVAEQYTSSDANGMPVPLQAIRLRATQAFGSGLQLSLLVAGVQKLPYR